MSAVLRRYFADLPVLVTGHTGFKGSWLSIWLRELGAKVIGYSLEPPTKPSHLEVCRLAERMTHIEADVRDLTTLQDAVATHRPVVVFHLAAQPLVLPSYEDPKETFDTNVIGTVNVLEAVRTTDSVKAVVCITTDKVYQDNGWLWGYRENDRLGGHDPYSASKAMAELAIASFRQSFFYDGYPAVASTRAGNVIGGGDFAAYRLVPDCMRALMAGIPIAVRNPNHVRPWQHVLECLSGYLWLATRLLAHKQKFAEAWNFGPLAQHNVTAQTIAEKSISLWGSGAWIDVSGGKAPKETSILRLSCEKATNRLQWQPVYTWEQALSATVQWYKMYQLRLEQPQVDMYDVSAAQIDQYAQRAQANPVAWASQDTA